MTCHPSAAVVCYSHAASHPSVAVAVVVLVAIMVVSMAPVVALVVRDGR